MKFFRTQLEMTKDFIKYRLLKKLMLVSISFFTLILIGIVVFSKNQELAKGLIDSFIEANKDIINSQGNITMIKLIENNVFASVYSILLGFIPFIFLPIIPLIVNSLLIGATLGFMSVTTSTSFMKIFVIGLLPHGILELPAILLSITMGIYLCCRITKKILGKEKNNLKDILKDMSRTFILIVIPLLLIAGLIECLVTPILINQFL